MRGIDDILSIDSSTEFDAAAIELFRYQAERCAPYREYVSLLGIEPQQVERVEQIPFLPIELFKSHRVYCGDGEPQIVFTSSSTGSGVASHHYVADVTIYERTFRRAFELFYGSPEGVSIYGLLPNYLAREGSSLVYMVDGLIRAGRGGGGFYLDDYERLIDDMARDTQPKILLGVSYALWDLAERYSPDLNGVIVMETGGMKGQREELPKEAFHDLLCRSFGVEQVHSEYGMAELTSQAYSFGGGVFRTPAWMRVVTRGMNDPFERVGVGRSGGVNIIDLANIYSCAFIQTQDMGVVHSDGSFRILGRIDRSDVRGCNLLVQ